MLSRSLGFLLDLDLDQNVFRERRGNKKKKKEEKLSILQTLNNFRSTLYSQSRLQIVSALLAIGCGSFEKDNESIRYPDGCRTDPIVDWCTGGNTLRVS